MGNWQCKVLTWLQTAAEQHRGNTADKSNFKHDSYIRVQELLIKGYSLLGTVRTKCRVFFSKIRQQMTEIPIRLPLFVQKFLWCSSFNGGGCSSRLWRVYSGLQWMVFWTATNLEVLQHGRSEGEFGKYSPVCTETITIHLQSCFLLACW